MLRRRDSATAGRQLLTKLGIEPMDAAYRLLEKHGRHNMTEKAFFDWLQGDAENVVFLRGQLVYIRGKEENRRFDDLFWCYATCDCDFVQRHFGVGK